MPQSSNECLSKQPDGWTCRLGPHELFPDPTGHVNSPFFICLQPTIITTSTTSDDHGLQLYWLHFLTKLLHCVSLQCTKMFPLLVNNKHLDWKLVHLMPNADSAQCSFVRNENKTHEGEILGHVGRGRCDENEGMSTFTRRRSSCRSTDKGPPEPDP